MRFRETPVEVTLEGERLTVAVQADGSGRTIRAGVGERVREIRDGKGHTFPL
jgi:hypothetical protein